MPTEPVSRRYLAILGVAAAGMLLLGTLLRPARTVPAVPSEAAVTPRVSGTALRDLSSELLARATTRARHLTWLPESRATAVAWESPGTLITTGRAGVQRLHRPGIAQEPAPVYRGPLSENGWLIAAARTAEGRTIWTAGMFGGTVPADCAGFAFNEVKFGAPLTEHFAGAALIDLDNRVVGIVVRCEGRLAAMSADAVSRALAAPPEPPGAWLARLFGIRTETVAEGLRVVEVSAGSPPGFRPGDVIPVLPLEPPAALEVLRDGRSIKVRLPGLSRARGMALETIRGGLRVRSVETGSAAERVGIEPGDVLVSAGTSAVTSTAAILKVLAEPGPEWIVYERAGNRRGVQMP